MAKERAPKKAFVLRISPDLMATLEKWADDEFRSVNGQIEFLLSEAVRKGNRQVRSGRNPEAGS